MSNAIRLEADQIGRRLDPAAVRRQFTLSLVIGLAVLAGAVAHGLQPARSGTAADGVRHQYVSAPQFVVARAAPVVAQRPNVFGALASLD
jgi:hypothetical protein